MVLKAYMSKKDKEMQNEKKKCMSEQLKGQYSQMTKKAYSPQLHLAMFSNSDTWFHLVSVASSNPYWYCSANWHCCKPPFVRSVDKHISSGIFYPLYKSACWSIALLLKIFSYYSHFVIVNLHYNSCLGLIF